LWALSGKQEVGVCILGRWGAQRTRGALTPCCARPFPPRCARPLCKQLCQSPAGGEGYKPGLWNQKQIVWMHLQPFQTAPAQPSVDQRRRAGVLKRSSVASAQPPYGCAFWARSGAVLAKKTPPPEGQGGLERYVKRCATGKARRFEYIATFDLDAVCLEGENPLPHAGRIASSAQSLGRLGVLGQNSADDDACPLLGQNSAASCPERAPVWGLGAGDAWPLEHACPPSLIR
jgi:hypothetical protein